MRVALVITELHPGGAETCLVNLACYLHARGHEVKVWQLWPAPPADRCQLTQQLDRAGISWRSGGARRAWHFLPAIRWLRGELRGFKPDVVQAFLFHANVAAALALGDPHCRLFGGARVSQPEGWRQWCQRWASRRMERVVCVSHSVANHLQHRERIAGEKLSVIPNGISLPDVHRLPPADWSQLGLPPGARVLLFVGRLSAQKGVLPFLHHAAERLLGGLPEHHVVLMGRGEQERALRQWCRTSPVGQRVHLVGWQAAPLAWMHTAELLFLPARYEGMPNVVLEAMSVGCPVASFDVDGVRELLGESHVTSQQLAPPGEWSALAAVITQLAQDPQTRSACGTANRRRVEQHFQLEPQLAKYEQLYLSPR